MSSAINTTRLTGTASAARTLGQYVTVAAAAGLIDWATKFLAVTMLGSNTHMLGDHLGLMLVFNQGAAGGASWGPYTWLINVGVTGLAVVMITLVVAPLAKVDRRAIWALGLVAGGAMGNLVSMVAGVDGVADFLAFRLGERVLVANVADFALWTGAVLLVPVIRRLLAAIRAEQAVKHGAAVRYLEA